MYNEAKAIVIVSHRMSLIKAMCHKVILLKNGRIQFFGDPEKAIEMYETEVVSQRSKKQLDSAFATREGAGDILYDSVDILDKNGKALGG